MLNIRIKLVELWLTRLLYEEKRTRKSIVGNIIKYLYSVKTINNMIICYMLEVAESRMFYANSKQLARIEFRFSFESSRHSRKNLSQLNYIISPTIGVCSNPVNHNNT